MTTKTIDQLCARDLGKRVRITLGSGDVAEGQLRHVVQSTRSSRLARFAFSDTYSMFEIQVGQFRLAGLNGRKEVEFR